MYKRIMVPLDGSRLAEQVLPWAKLLAGAFHSRLDLLRVFAPVSAEMVGASHGLYLNNLSEALRSQAMDYLVDLRRPLADGAREISCTVREGDAASCIIAEAAEEAGTLIAMTTHGRSGVGRWLLGSVADKVLRAATNPLLVVRAVEGGIAPAEAKLDTLLVPLDGSPLAEQVLPHVVALANAMALTVVLVHVIPPARSYYMYADYPYGTAEDLVRQAHDVATAYLRQAAKKLSIQEVAPRIERRVLQGYPAGTIVDLARDISHDLVAMTTHGRSGLGRWVLGSVTDKVVRHSGDPVLVVRAA